MASAPKAKKILYEFEMHGETYSDDYHWLREKENPEVLKYLKEENDYTQEVMSDTDGMQAELYKELRGRIKESDQSVPVHWDNYFYYIRTEEGDEYPVYCRKKDSLDSPEEVLLDQNQLAQGHEHCSLGTFKISPDHKLLAYSVDFTGSERYTIFVKNLETGETLSDEIVDTVSRVEWFSDSQTFLYLLRKPEDMRPYQVKRHRLGQKDDEVLFEENDEKFYMALYKSRSRKYIFVSSESKLTGESRYIDADNTDSSFTVLLPRETNHLYYPEHHSNNFYIKTNADGAKNFKLIRTPIKAPQKEHWETIIEADEAVFLSGFEVFDKYIYVFERSDGIKKIKVLSILDGSHHYIDLPEAVYETHTSANPDFFSESFFFTYSSLITPETVYRYDTIDKTLEVLKQKEVLGGYSTEDYVVERIYAEASDGAKVPVTIARRKDTPTDGTAPGWLSGYGSYGYSYPVGFDSNEVSLLDRGFVCAIAHVRGGSDKGRGWYEEGKFLNKKNTFTDFIAVTESLIDKKYIARDKLLISGGSAGGLLMGAVINLRPDLFAGVIAGVPFVDVINTMIDPTISLTVMEYEEWGDPNDKEYFDYIRSYSPYDNVEAKDYPNMLVTAGLNDSRVQYWEPAKWVAKLRDKKKDNNMLLLKTEMGHGHSGATGRFEYLKEIALEYAFLLKVLGRHK